jgi:hypothetical protein
MTPPTPARSAHCHNPDRASGDWLKGARYRMRRPISAVS